MSVRRHVGLLLLLLSACGGGAGEAVQTTTSDISAAATPESITFSPDWTETASPSLVAGQPIAIAYDAARLAPTCGGSATSPGGNGGFAWSITGYYSVAGAAAVSFQVPITSAWTTTTSTITPETAGSLAIWFGCGNTSGQTGWDSSFGKNYQFTVSAAAGDVDAGGPPVLDFLTGWKTTQSAPLVSGGTVVVNYDLSRLPQCRATTDGVAAWNIAVYWATDGGAAQSAAVTTGSGETLVSTPVTLAIRPGSNLAIWFFASDDAGCSQWDSNFGANYDFPLSPP